MASENETVEAAIAAVRRMIHECPAIRGGGEYQYQLKANGAIDRIEAAHRREKAGLVRSLDALEKAMDRVCSRDEIAEIMAVREEIQDAAQ